MLAPYAKMMGLWQLSFVLDKCGPGFWGGSVWAGGLHQAATRSRISPELRYTLGDLPTHYYDHKK